MASYPLNGGFRISWLSDYTQRLITNRNHSNVGPLLSAEISNDDVVWSSWRQQWKMVGSREHMSTTQRHMKKHGNPLKNWKPFPSQLLELLSIHRAFRPSTHPSSCVTLEAETCKMENETEMEEQCFFFRTVFSLAGAKGCGGKAIHFNNTTSTWTETQEK